MLAWLSRNKTILQWIITSLLRLLAGYFAVKFGKDAIAQESWDALGEGILAVLIAGSSIYTSVNARRKLAEAPSTLNDPTITIKPDDPAQDTTK